MTDISSDGTTSTAPVVGALETGDRGVHNLGYRRWSGDREPNWTRWTVIASIGARRAWQNNWLKRMLFFAWLPTIAFGFSFFMWEQAALYPEWRQMLRPAIQSLPPTPVFQQVKSAVYGGDMAGSRHTVWAWLLNSFFRYPQAVVMVLMVGMIAPPLISQDIRSRAFLLYFSRPLTRLEYVAGKTASIFAYLAMISAVPALSLYAIGVVLSPSLDVLYSTWDLPLRILLASVVLMLPTSTLALCLSSLTQESRYAGFAWFAVWILGWFTYGAAASAEAFNAQQQMYRENRMVEIQESMWSHLSLYHTLGRVQSWVFGFSELRDVLASIAILIVVTSASLTILFYRISAPMRV